jgi:hypothetical protein
MSIPGLDLTSTTILIVAAAVIVLLGAFIWFIRRRPKKLNLAEFREKWQSAQSLCAKQETWPLAIINGDKLLDDALKRRRYKGKTMGERMVSAQHDITDNDSMWYGHKLRNKLVHEEMKKLKKKDVMTALIGFREALKDLGAL